MFTLIATVVGIGTAVFIGWVLYDCGYDNGYLDGYDTAHRDIADNEPEDDDDAA